MRKQLLFSAFMALGFTLFAASHSVTVSNNFFSPSSLTINVGDSVTWTNSSGNHNVNGNISSYPSNPASFGNGSASMNWTYTKVFTVAGSYGYRCDPHFSFGMTGTITVNAAPPVANPCSDLFFSEYIEGGSNNKAIEIYNPTGSSINLTGYTVSMFSNGSSTVTSSLALYGTLASGDVFVYSADQANAAILAQADTALSYLSPAHFNGNDAVILLNSNNDTIDAIGVVGVDPGSSGWTVGTGSTKDYTLVRKAMVDGGTKDWTVGATEWDVHPKDTTMFLGAHTSNCVAAPAAPCTELFFSEYIEGGSNNKAIEIYNPTGSSINLTGYTVSMFSNGSSTVTASLALYGSLAAGDVFVYCADQANATILAKADTALSYPSPAHFNGNDAVVLLNSNNDTIDAIGVVGVDPGSSGWTVGTGSTKDYTLVRMATVDAGTNDWTAGATEWDVHPKDTTMFLGAHTSNCSSAGTQCAELFFSEYIEGSSNNKAMEIYNPTGSSINLTGYTVSMFSNGSSTVTASLALYGTLASGDVFIFCADQANATILALADTALSYPSPAHFNGNDAVVLLNSNNDTIDAIGTVGVDPGSSGWTVGTGSTKDYTLVRMATVNGGINDWTVGATEWDVYAQNTTTYLGNHISNCVGGPQLPAISFTSSSQTHVEGVGPQDVVMVVNPVSPNAETVKVYVLEGLGITSGDYTLNPAAVMDTLTFNLAANQDSVIFTVSIIDDIIMESSETITFSIEQISAGLTLGNIVSHDFIIDDNDTPIPTYTIGQIDGLDSDLVVDSLGVECKVEGVVLGVDLQGVASNLVQFTFHDGTDGFGLFSSNLTGFIVTEGDLVRVIGKVAQFNGLAQMSADSIVIISQNNNIPTPTVVTALDETTESELVRINGVTILDPTQWTNAGSGFTVDISNGTDTFALRIDNEVDLFNMPAPVGIFDVIAIGSQYDSSIPHNSGYQMLPRYSADIIYPAPFTYDLHVSEIMPGSVDPNSATSADWFELINYGSTSIDLNGFSFDDNSETPGTAIFGNVTIAAGEVIVVWRGMAADKAAFLSSWRATTGNPQVIASDELTGTYPGFGQGGDMVVLYDTTSGVPIEICKAQYASANAGFSKEFDTTCLVTGNAVDGQNGAYMSNNGDVGSPGNVSPDISVNENELTGVKVYPNPAKDVLFIEFSEGAEATKIELTNLMGQSIISTEFNDNRFNLDLSNLPKGMYLVKFTRGNKTAVKNIIVQ